MFSTEAAEVRASVLTGEKREEKDLAGMRGKGERRMSAGIGLAGLYELQSTYLDDGAERGGHGLAA
jgi:hypothetical protein